jgi:hypothetical protein
MRGRKTNRSISPAQIPTPFIREWFSALSCSLSVNLLPLEVSVLSRYIASEAGWRAEK